MCQSFTSKTWVLHQILSKGTSFFTEINAKYTEKGQFLIDVVYEMFNLSFPISDDDKLVFSVYQQYCRQAKKLAWLLPKVDYELSIRLLPVKLDLSLDKEHARKIPIEYVSLLALDLMYYGYMGKIEFCLPYHRDVEELWCKLSSDNCIYAFEINYKQFQIESNKRVIVKNSDRTLIAFMDVNATEYKVLDELVIHGRSYLRVKVTLCDIFSLIAKQTYLQVVYTEKNYCNFIQQFFSQYSKVLSVKVSHKCESLYKQRHWFAVSCNFPEVSLFDYLFKTLSFYQLHLCYDYSVKNHQDHNGPISYYNIQNKQEISQYLSATKECVTLSQALISRRRDLFNHLSLAKHKFKNCYWKNQPDVRSSGDQKSRSSYKLETSHILLEPTTEALKHQKNKRSEMFISQRKAQKWLEVQLKTLPSQGIIFPLQKIALQSGKQSSSDRQKSQSFCTRMSRVSFMNPDSILFAEMDKRTQYKLEKLTIHDAFQHRILTEIQLQFCNGFSLQQPKHNSDEVSLHCYGKIKAVDGGSPVYMLCTDKQTNQHTNINNSLVQTPLNADIPKIKTQSLFYRVELICSDLGVDGSNKTVIVFLPFAYLDDYSFIPYKHDTVVKITLYQEHGVINEVCWIHTDTPTKDLEIDKEKFRNLICMGAGNVLFEHTAKYKNVDDGSFRIKSTTKSTVTQYSCDKNGVVLSYEKSNKK